MMYVAKETASGKFGVWLQENYAGQLQPIEVFGLEYETAVAVIAALNKAHERGKKDAFAELRKLISAADR